MQHLTPLLRVRDLDRTIRFYTEVLGFRLCWKHPDEGEADTCRLERDEVGLMFSIAENIGKEPSLAGTLYITTPDVEALWEAFKDQAEVAWELQEMDYGTLEFAIRDPDGYLLAFARERPPSS